MCRVYAARGVVDGYGLLHELLADAVQDLFGQVSKEMQGSSSVAGATADTWTMVQSVTTEPCRDNAIGEQDACSLAHDPRCVMLMHQLSCLLIISCGLYTTTASSTTAAPQLWGMYSLLLWAWGAKWLQAQGGAGSFAATRQGHFQDLAAALQVVYRCVQSC